MIHNCALNKKKSTLKGYKIKQEFNLMEFIGRVDQQQLKLSLKSCSLISLE